jgi:DNA-binding CsgD family transcriptional regulator
VLLVEGESGMGKSRLLEDAVEAAAGRGFMLAQDAADEPSRLAPLMPLMRALGESVNMLRTGEETIPADVADLRLWLLRRLQARLEERASRGRLLIALDDLQWADPTTFLALRTLTSELASYPLVWILSRTIGDGDVGGLYDVLERDGATRITLEALDDHAVAEIVADVLGASPEPDLLTLASGAGGNPFLLVALLRGLKDEGTVEIIGGRARLTARRLPRRVQEVVLRRLGALSPFTRNLLQVAAVLGRSFSLDDLGEMLGEDPGRLLPALDEAEAAEVLAPAGDMRTFRQDLLWRAVTETVTPPVRQALHRQAAEILLKRGGSAIPAAAHLMRYARREDAQALAGLDRAAQEVLPSSPLTAADIAVRALELTGSLDPARFTRTVTAIFALTTAGRLTEAAGLARTALSQTVLPDQTAHLRTALANTLLLAGQATEAVTEAEKALDEPALTGELRGFAEQTLFVGMLANHDRRGRKRAEAVVAAAEHHSSSALVGAHMVLTTIIWGEGRAVEAIGHIREAVRVAVGEPIQATYVCPRLHLVNLLTDLRRLEEAETALRTADEEIAAFGETAHAAIPAFMRARLRLVQGRLDDAAAEAEAGLAMADEMGMHGFDLLGLAVLALVAVRRGDMDTAARHVERYKSRYGRGARYGRRWGNWAVALVVGAKDGPRTALGELPAPLTDPLEQSRLLMTEPLAAPWLVRTALAAADPGIAEAVAATAERLADGNPVFSSLAASAAQARGLLRGDPEALARAAAVHVAPWDRASAAEDLGVLLAARGSGRKAAVRSLDQALDGYQRTGALGDAARVRARLRRLGVRRRHWSQAERPVAGWGSLTDTERKVAELVGRGLTNSQVATRMFVSPHTVKFHLRQIFRKLGIGSRVELARYGAAQTRFQP